MTNTNMATIVDDDYDDDYDDAAGGEGALFERFGTRSNPVIELTKLNKKDVPKEQFPILPGHVDEHFFGSDHTPHDINIPEQIPTPQKSKLPEYGLIGAITLFTVLAALGVTGHLGGGKTNNHNRIRHKPYKKTSKQKKVHGHTHILTPKKYKKHKNTKKTQKQ